MRSLRQALLLLTLLFLFPVLIHSQEANEPSGALSSSTPRYQASTDGLRLLLEDGLAVVGGHNRPKLESFIHQMEIPSYEEWFTKTFGEEMGGSWGGLYKSDLGKNEEEFQAMLMQLGEQNGQVSIRKVNDAPDPARGLEKDLLGALIQPADIFFASWKVRGAPPKTAGFPVGYFVFIDGGFRWDSSVTFHPGAGGVGIPACFYCPDPVYTPDARAKQLRGTVVLEAIIQPDGRVTDVKVVKTSDVELAPMAVKTVEGWRYKPARGRNGKPVAVTMPIQVNFHFGAMARPR